ncbi:MAG TPA: UDP-N-acetylglucosamine 1-carboxyvinyltransferase [Ignavibacteria bacterium]
MYKFIIEGGQKLKGEVEISGAKNASLALIPATLLANGEFKLYNTPDLRDITTMSQLMRSIGAKIKLEENTLTVNTKKIKKFEAPYELVKKMRASIYVLGPLLGRYNQAKVSLPGGCAWGPRPVNLHIEGLKKLGANIDLQEGYIIAKTKGLKGADITFDISSVGATGNILMAATLAKGETRIQNAAIEPEITSLAEFLVKMGAKIEGIGTNQLLIQGVDELKPTDFNTIPDRIETGTFLIAAAITKGNIKVVNCIPQHCDALLYKLKEVGCSIEIGENWIKLKGNDVIRPVDVTTAIYPGFPTDMQAQWMALMSIAEGSSVLTETIYYDRFKHVPELIRLGANIDVNENVAVIKGVKKLKGAKVMSTDLRASASLILAGLIAEGKTEVLRVYHLDRGYENIEKKLQKLGANIKRRYYQEF